MKKIITAVIVLAFALGVGTGPVAHADGMTSEENSIALNVIYAEQILYCNSNLQFEKYKYGEFFDNDGSCIDPRELFANGADGWAQLAMKYPGGYHRWAINADAGKTCWFFIYHGDPKPDPQFLVWDTFFTACSVLINQPVSENWVMFDYEFPQTSPVFEKCADTVAPYTGYENNCLQFGTYNDPSNGNVTSGTGTVINKAAAILKKKFYSPFKAWLSYNRKANNMYAVVSKTPAGAKVYVQKFVDYHWINVKSGERFWEGRSFVFYNKASAGKYRIYIKTVTGLKYISKTLVV